MTVQPTTPPPMKPDLGLYQTKYILRAWLRKIPGIGRLSPNVLSVLAIVPGLLAAYCLYHSYYLGAILAIMGRMIINTLDGLIAEEFDKKSHLGAYLNRLPGEFTDILIVMGLWPHGSLYWVMALVALTGWVQMIGILPLAAGGKGQSVGPCGQTDRLAIILISCVVALSGVDVWRYMIPALCYGCGLTLLIRIYRSIRDIKTLDSRA
jgi:phosphatidylglycerophosphate synthase